MLTSIHQDAVQVEKVKLHSDSSIRSSSSRFIARRGGHGRKNTVKDFYFRYLNLNVYHSLVDLKKNERQGLYVMFHWCSLHPEGGGGRERGKVEERRGQQAQKGQSVLFGRKRKLEKTPRLHISKCYKNVYQYGQEWSDYSMGVCGAGERACRGGSSVHHSIHQSISRLHTIFHAFSKGIEGGGGAFFFWP